MWRETVPFTTLASGAKNFNPLPPCGGRHPEQLDLEQEEKISIHSLRVEGDVPVVGILQFGLRFQSTPSVWRETSVLVFLRSYAGNFNPLPPCGGRHSHTHTLIVCSNISIHSLRVEGDLRSRLGNASCGISIHSLRVEGDVFPFTISFEIYGFQSTPSVWRETSCMTFHTSYCNNFNPLPPCGGRPTRANVKSGYRHFNPLPPCGGRRV